jgi:hypothetical protein
MTAPNAELAYKVLDHIDTNPEQWNQTDWITKGDGEDCGTAGCFAGWACMLSGWKPYFVDQYRTRTGLVMIGGRDSMIAERAPDLLGISYTQADDLFHEDNTREDLGRLVAEIFGPRPDVTA